MGKEGWVSGGGGVGEWGRRGGGVGKEGWVSGEGGKTDDV